MKRPKITPGDWFPVYDNPLSILRGHTIKSKGVVKTPVAEAFKGIGASAKGMAEQRANAMAIAALPKLLRALERSLERITAMIELDSIGEPPDIVRDKIKTHPDLIAIQQALTAAGYDFSEPKA